MWKKITDNKLVIAFAVLIILTSIFYLTVLYITNLKFYDVNLITSTVLFATFLAMCFYTYATWKLKDLTSKDITYTIRPFVIFEFGGNYHIKNIGNGIALKINIDKIPIKDIGTGNNSINTKVAYITFDSFGCLEKGKNPVQTLSIYMCDSNKKDTIDDQLAKNIHGGTNTMTKFKMLIRYEDIDGEKYITPMAIKDRMFQVVDRKEWENL